MTKTIDWIWIETYLLYLNRTIFLKSIQTVLHTLHFLKKNLLVGSLNALNIIQFAIKKNQLNIDSQNMNWISSMLPSHQIIHESPPTTVSTWIWWTHYALRIILSFVQDCWLNLISAAIIQIPMCLLSFVIWNSGK